MSGSVETDPRNSNPQDSVSSSSILLVSMALSRCHEVGSVNILITRKTSEQSLLQFVLNQECSLSKRGLSLTSRLALCPCLHHTRTKPHLRPCLHHTRTRPGV